MHLHQLHVTPWTIALRPKRLSTTLKQAWTTAFHRLVKREENFTFVPTGEVDQRIIFVESEVRDKELLRFHRAASLNFFINAPLAVARRAVARSLPSNQRMRIDT